MTTEELEMRGISFSGNYNYFPPHFFPCHPQHSYLHITGSCVNNNTEVYCVIVGNLPLPFNNYTTSSIIANLTIKGYL